MLVLRHSNIIKMMKDAYILWILPGRILGDVNLNLDDKAAIKARGLWEDWHLRQLIDHPARTNHVSGKEHLRLWLIDFT